MCHALIIEDEPFIALMIEDTLIEHGAHSVAIAASEGEAVEEARRRRPDFITSDVRLIEGTGPRAVAAIKAVCGEVPTLFITGTPSECDDCAPDTVLGKPVDYTEVGRRFSQMRR